VRDSDVLFIYDAKLTNPNGDPDEENRPRMDEATGRNLVSDVRLKRYLRDYWLDRGYDVWVRRVDGATVDAKKRMDRLISDYNAETGQKLKKSEATKDAQFLSWLLDRLIDARMFGATITLEKTSLSFTGPVQFSWGYSLNRVEINPSATISSTFAGRDKDKGEYGTFGKDWRVVYSLIAFHGIVSAGRAVHTRLTEEDILALDRALIEAIPDQATTRSKIGQTPRLYLRIEYREPEANGPLIVDRRLGDMRNDIALRPLVGKTDVIRDVSDFTLDVERLITRISERRHHIAKVVVYQHPDLITTLSDELMQILKDGDVSLVHL
jgi:CRISPR-associated protein Cas7/Csh2, subtype I-B/HMARI